MKRGLISVGSLRMLFYQMDALHCERRALDRVLHEVLDEVVWLSKVIDLQVYNLVNTVSSDNLACNFHNSLVNKCYFSVGSFMIGSFMQTDDFDFERHSDEAIQSSSLE